MSKALDKIAPLLFFIAFWLIIAGGVKGGMWLVGYHTPTQAKCTEATLNSDICDGAFPGNYYPSTPWDRP